MKTYNALSKSFTDEVKTQMGGGKSIDAAFELVKPSNANGHEYVDLDLPSGTIWATCNVGADKPEDSGLLFQFGRVDGYAYGDSNNQFRTQNQNDEDTGHSYIPLTTSGRTYNEGETLSLEDDAAHVNMGGAWKMPTKEDIEELLKYTNHEVTSINEVQGTMFTSKLNTQQLFIPFAGYMYLYGHFYNAGSKAYVWSSKVSTSNNNNADAYGLYCDSSDNNVSGYNGFRISGHSVRGVFKTSPKPKPTPKPIDVNKLTQGDGKQENGFYYVDLGLSVKWATCNIGATLASDDGKLFQFGRVDGYTYNDENHQFRTAEQNTQDTGNEVIPKTETGKTYNAGETLDLADDAAHVNMGGVWRMPTCSLTIFDDEHYEYSGELVELINNTTREIVTVNGVQGMLFKSKINGHQLFIPFIQGVWIEGQWGNMDRNFGAIWSSQVTYADEGANVLMCDAEYNADVSGEVPRYYALPARGVF